MSIMKSPILPNPGSAATIIHHTGRGKNIWVSGPRPIHSPVLAVNENISNNTDLY
jgi:hypothetical protein